MASEKSLTIRGPSRSDCVAATTLRGPSAPTRTSASSTTTFGSPPSCSRSSSIVPVVPLWETSRSRTCQRWLLFSVRAKPRSARAVQKAFRTSFFPPSLVAETRCSGSAPAYSTPRRISTPSSSAFLVSSAWSSSMPKWQKSASAKTAWCASLGRNCLPENFSTSLRTHGHKCNLFILLSQSVRFSTTSTSCPPRSNSIASRSPHGPAPTITTFFFSATLLRRGSLSRFCHTFWHFQFMHPLIARRMKWYGKFSLPYFGFELALVPTEEQPPAVDFLPTAPPTGAPGCKKGSSSEALVTTVIKCSNWRKIVPTSASAMNCVKRSATRCERSTRTMLRRIDRRLRVVSPFTWLGAAAPGTSRWAPETLFPVAIAAFALAPLVLALTVRSSPDPLTAVVLPEARRALAVVAAEKTTGDELKPVGARAGGAPTTSAEALLVCACAVVDVFRAGRPKSVPT
mmetsp:Transcript_22994/g.58108  ORF Transcript_22994/g.58108 Transcript_22994/m.58108 type:complete len:457 (-) Transcript_22994:559-1929(-)